MSMLALFSLDSAFTFYLIFFLLPILSSIFLPVPEEVILLLGGYVAYLGFVNYWMVAAVLVLGIMGGDLVAYSLGRFFGDWTNRVFLRHIPFAKRALEKSKALFDKHGEKVVLFSRPLLSIRMVVPILAGHFRMKLARFIAYDFAVSAVWTLLLVSLSYFFGYGLDLVPEIRALKHYFFIGLGVAILVYAILKFMHTDEVKAELKNSN